MNKYLKQLLDALAAKNLEIQGHMTKSLDAGQTPDEETEKSIQAVEAEIEQIEKNIARVKKQIAAAEQAAQTATPVAGQTPAQAKATAEGNPNPAEPTPKIEIVKTLPKGAGYTMAVKATALAGKSIAKGVPTDALSILKHWGAPEEVQDIIRAKAVGTTTDANFASALVNQEVLTNEFIELLRPKTILGRLSGFRTVPFNVKIPLQTGTSTVGWVGEGKNKPVTNPQFGTVTLGKHKVAGIVIMTDELVADSSPSALNLTQNDLLDAMAQHADGAFIDPTKAAVDGVNPASVTNGLTSDDAFASAGVTAADYEADFVKAIKRFTEANLPLDGSYWLMSETKATELAILRDALGGTYFKGMELGGDAKLLNLPVVTSQNVGNQIVLIKPSEILLADDGGVDFAMSTEASIQIGVDEDDNPVMVNLFQQNMTAVRAEQFKTWKKSRNLGVVRIIYS
ncbi:phage major capsid protein [Acinetobacter thermotolerans]|uniref:phage major capsid protein n=1 Tax=Acinetobacter thermotolerans TaxID=3151487 RepID=UPI00325A6142